MTKTRAVILNNTAIDAVAKKYIKTDLSIGVSEPLVSKRRKSTRTGHEGFGNGDSKDILQDRNRKRSRSCFLAVLARE